LYDEITGEAFNEGEVFANFVLIRVDLGRYISNCYAESIEGWWKSDEDTGGDGDRECNVNE
jgi:hypothetical protein